MAAVLQTTFLNTFSWMKRFFYFDSDFTEVCSYGPIDNNLALIQVMAWWRTGLYLHQCLPNSPVHICGTRGRWVRETVSTHYPITEHRIRPPIYFTHLPDSAYLLRLSTTFNIASLALAFILCVSDWMLRRAVVKVDCDTSYRDKLKDVN